MGCVEILKSRIIDIDRVTYDTFNESLGLIESHVLLRSQGTWKHLCGDINYKDSDWYCVEMDDISRKVLNDLRIDSYYGK